MPDIRLDFAIFLCQDPSYAIYQGDMQAALISHMSPRTTPQIFLYATVNFCLPLLYSVVIEEYAIVFERSTQHQWPQAEVESKKFNPTRQNKRR